MKKLLLFALLLPLAAFGQIQINKAIQLVGAGSDAKIEGIQEVLNDHDAANKMYVDTSIQNRMNEPILFGSIDYSAINAAPTSDYISITLPNPSIPAGYSIGHIWLVCSEAFYSPTRPIIPAYWTAFIETISPTTTLSEAPIQNRFFLSTGDNVLIVPNAISEYLSFTSIVPLDVKAGNYTNGLRFTFVFGGAGDNPNDFIKGNLDVFLELKKTPIN